MIALLLLIGGAVGVGLYLRARNRDLAIESIAVMPFVNESGNADVEYLSDGMTETLISSLSNLPNLNVKPPHNGRAPGQPPFRPAIQGFAETDESAGMNLKG